MVSYFFGLLKGKIIVSIIIPGYSSIFAWYKR